jgi:RNA polymerase sigma-70 factor, ECF subfamily
MFDPGKTTDSSAHERPVEPSISTEPVCSGGQPEKLPEEGKSAIDRADKLRQSEIGVPRATESQSESGTMGMSVALEGDARQAAAAKLAEEHGLVRKAQGGDRLAFEELVRRYDRDVLRLALNLVRRPEDAHDIYQESFLRAYRNLQRFRFECSFYTWVYRIVTNVALDHLRRRSSRREDQAPATEAADGNPTDFFDRQPEMGAAANPERNLLGRELGQQIAAALNELSPRERMVFEMKHYHGMKLRAIGDLLGTSEETAKNSLFRATRKLRANLECLR